MLGGIRYRSRLEAKWASLFGVLGWRFSYEPLDLRGADGRTRIPDFMVHATPHPFLLECKPAVSIDEITGLRRSLVMTAMNWLTAGAEAELAALDAAPDAPGDLERADELNAYVDDLHERGDISLWYRGRKALVVGSRLFDFQDCLSLPPHAKPADTYGVGLMTPDGVTVDGWHYLTACVGHVGLHNHRECLVCGMVGAGEPLPSAKVQEMWIVAGNATQWKAPT